MITSLITAMIKQWKDCSHRRRNDRKLRSCSKAKGETIKDIDFAYRRIWKCTIRQRDKHGPPNHVILL